MAELISSVPAIETTIWDLIFAPLLDDPDFKSLPINFLYGNMPRELFFNTNLDKTGYKKVDCGWTFSGGTDFTKKKLDPIEVAISPEQCYKTILKKLFGDKLPDGWQRGELSAEVKNYIMTQVNYAFNRDMLSWWFLGVAGSAIPYYDKYDGLYESLKDGVAAVDGTVETPEITDTDLLPANFFATMNAQYLAQTRQLRGTPDNKKLWIWTSTIMDAYKTYLETSTQGTAGALQTEYVVNGVNVLKFKGIPIFEAKIVDERLGQDFSTSGVVEFPNRSVLTRPDNHSIQMDGDGFKNLDMWYDKKDGKVYTVGSGLIDYKYGYGYFNVTSKNY